MMTWSRSAIVLFLLGTVLRPGGARADETIGATVAAPESASTSGERPGGYVFPSAGDQFRSWAANAFGPPAIAGNLAGASWRQWVTEEPPEWGVAGRGFAKRFGSGSLTTALSETSLSLISAAMRQDAGYYRAPRTGFGRRLLHAVAMTFMARDREGDKVFSPGKAFSPFVGPVVTRITLYPERYGYADGLANGAYGLLINAGLNAAHEFILSTPPWGDERPRVP